MVRSDIGAYQDRVELGDRADDLEEHPPHRGAGVDALVEHHQVHAAGLEILGQVDEVLQERRSRSSLVTTSWSPSRATSGARSSSGRWDQLAGRLVDEHLIATRGRPGVTLGAGILVAGGYPSVADLPWRGTAPVTSDSLTKLRTRHALHPAPAETPHRRKVSANDRLRQPACYRTGSPRPRPPRPGWPDVAAGRGCLTWLVANGRDGGDQGSSAR